MTKIAKPFVSGRSQTVCLPAKFRSYKPNNWDSFFAALKDAKVDESLLSKEERDLG